MFKKCDYCTQVLCLFNIKITNKDNSVFKNKKYILIVKTSSLSHLTYIDQTIELKKKDLPFYKKKISEYKLFILTTKLTQNNIAL